MQKCSKIQAACRSVVAASAIASLSGMAGARPLHEPTERIVVRDLDLTTAAGIAKLDRRIRVAARNVCMPETSIQPFKISAAVDRCVTKAVADAASARDSLVRRAGVASRSDQVAEWPWISASNEVAAH
jgi:UrcA family protein